MLLGVCDMLSVESTRSHQSDYNTGLRDLERREGEKPGFLGKERLEPRYFGLNGQETSGVIVIGTIVGVAVGAAGIAMVASARASNSGSRSPQAKVADLKRRHPS